MPKSERNGRRWFENGQMAIVTTECYGGIGTEVEIKSLGGETSDGRHAIYYVVEYQSRQCYPISDQYLKRPERSPTR